MTFIKELLLALILLSLLICGVVYYYSIGDPIGFSNAIKSVIDIKTDDISKVDKLSWVKINNIEELVKLYPNVKPTNCKDGYLFILYMGSDKNDNSIKTFLQNKRFQHFTFFPKNASPIKWQGDKSNINEVMKLGRSRHIGQPVASIVLQMATFKPWEHIHKPKLNDVKKTFEIIIHSQKVQIQKPPSNIPGSSSSMQ